MATFTTQEVIDLIFESLDVHEKMPEGSSKNGVEWEKGFLAAHYELIELFKQSGRFLDMN